LHSVGQVGGAKLADGLYRPAGKDLALIVQHRATIRAPRAFAFSPDLDTCRSIPSPGTGLAPKAGWEPAGRDALAARHAEGARRPEQPLLGDKSLAAPLLRTQGPRRRAAA
jgi:hypothetical protein